MVIPVDLRRGARTVCASVLVGLCAGCGPAWNSVGGGENARALLLVAAALAGLVFFVRPLAQARPWIALAVISYAAVLQIIEAGPHARYQRLLRPDELTDASHLPSLLIILVQVALIGFALRKDLKPLGRFIKDHAPKGLWIVIGIALVGSSANELWKTRSQWIIEMAMAGSLAALQLANLVVVAKTLPADLTARVTAFIDGPSEPRRFFDRYAVVLGVFSAAMALALGGIAYDWYPHIPDENVYLYHARYFAESKLFVVPPPVPETFNMDLMLFEANRLYSPVPLGWPAVLSLGVRVGVPWLVNPLLAGLAVIILHALVAEVYDRRLARWAALLLATSPWFLFVSMTLMTHNASLVFALLGAWCVARLRNDGEFVWCIVGGACIGCVSLIRPLEGAIVAALLGPWCLLQRGQPIVKLVLRSAVLTAATAIVGMLVAPYNRALTGKPFYFPIMAYVDRLYAPGANDIGFGPNRGLGWTGLDPRHGHNLRDMALNTDLNIFAVNVELLGWACGSIVVLAAVIFSRRIRIPDVWMALAIGAVSGVHGLYWFSGGPDFGARYWFLVIAPCIILAARGIDAVGDTAEERRAGGRAQVFGAAVIAIAIAMTVFMPWRVMDKYRDYRGVKAQFRSLVADRGMTGELILLYGEQDPDYSPAATLNPTDFEGPGTIVSWDRSEATSRRVVDAFTGRKVWLVRGPSASDNKEYEVVAGPLSGDQAKEKLSTLWATRPPMDKAANEN